MLRRSREAASAWFSSRCYFCANFNEDFEEGCGMKDFMRKAGGIAVVVLAALLLAGGCTSPAGDNPSGPAEENPFKPSPPAQSNLGIIIDFGYGELTITGSGETTIIQGGTPDSLTLSAEGYEEVKWHVDGSDTPLSGNSLTLNAEDYTPKPHSVAFTGLRGGRPYSKLIPFTVEEENSGALPPVNATELAAYLAGLSENAADTPHTVALDSSVEVNSEVQWGTTIKGIITAAQKYLVLDLSACAATRTEGWSYPDNPSQPLFYFDFMGKENEYVVGIILPESLAEIGEKSFSQWSSLRSVSIPAGVTSIGDYAFEGCAALGSITLPTGLQSVGLYAFYGCSSLESMVIPAGVSAIENRAFYQCAALADIAIPWGVSSIGDEAFAYCAALRQIIFPPGIESIGSSAFSNCAGLVAIAIPEGVTTLKTNTFASCAKLETVTLPSTLRAIELNAFSGCSSLTSITIPVGVNTIESGAFTSCVNLARITFEGYTAKLGVKRGANSGASFPSGFDAFYNSQIVKAGAYAYADGAWRKN
jgi:hypothetical protein